MIEAFASAILFDASWHVIVRPDGVKFMSSLEVDIPLLEISNVLFPHARIVIEVNEEGNELMVTSCIARRMPFGVVFSCADGVHMLAQRRVIGTAAGIIHVERSPTGTMLVLARGYRRFSVLKILRQEPYLVAKVQFPSGFVALHSGMLALSNRVAAMFQRYVELAYEPHVRSRREFSLPNSPVDLAFAVAAALHIPTQEKQMLLETFNAHELLLSLSQILQREIERLTSDEDYRASVCANATRLLPPQPL